MTPQLMSFLTFQERLNGWLLAYAVLAARPMALLTIMPVFARAQLTGFLKGGMIMAFVLPVFLPFLGVMEKANYGAGYLVLVTVKEAFLGAMLGIAFSVPFWAVMITGDLMDIQRGQTQSRLQQPGGDGDLSVTGTLLLLGAICVFVITGGLQAFVSALYDSWTVWRPLDMMPMPSLATPDLILGLLDTIFRRGFEFALPAIMGMLLSDAAMLIIVRIAPQLHLDDVMSAGRNLVFAIFMPLYIGYLMYYDAQDQLHIDAVVQMVTPSLRPPAHPPTIGSP